MKFFARADNAERVFSLSYRVSELIESNEGPLMRRVMDDLAKRLADDVYADVLKAVNKDTIVQEVSTRVATEVISKLYGKGKEDD